jgi:hypothetical protein
MCTSALKPSVERLRKWQTRSQTSCPPNKRRTKSNDARSVLRSRSSLPQRSTAKPAKPPAYSTARSAERTGPIKAASVGRWPVLPYEGHMQLRSTLCSGWRGLLARLLDSDKTSTVAARRRSDRPANGRFVYCLPIENQSFVSSGDGASIPGFSFPGFDSIQGVILAKHRPKFPTALRGLLAKPLLKQDR